MFRQNLVDREYKLPESAAPNCYRHSRAGGSRRHADKFPSVLRPLDRPNQIAEQLYFLRRSEVETANGSCRTSGNIGEPSEVRSLKEMPTTFKSLKQCRTVHI